MTWVKICGTTNLDDAATAVEAGADAIGFVFYEKSPRNIAVDAAREIIDNLPDKVEKIGVFVDADCDQMREVVLNVGLTAVQAHGGRAGESLWRDNRTPLESVGVAKLIGMTPGDALRESGIGIPNRLREKLFALLLDSRTNGASGGGSGIVFDWDAARDVVRALSLTVPVIIAGGLTVVNVGEALKTFRPFGVDVVSGVEASPGKKDPEKVRAFVRAVREMDSKTS